jgi:hypothetical protein
VRAVADILRALEPPAGIARLAAPPYTGDGTGARVMMAVKAMESHVTDEGAQLQYGLEHAGYLLAGHGYDYGETDARQVIYDRRPAVVLVQDERESQGLTAGRRAADPKVKFRHTDALCGRPDVFVGTVIKDAQNNPKFHRDSAQRMGAHFWVGYYHPDIVCRLAPFVRKEHYVRTWHTVDRDKVPPYSPLGRAGCLLSGAIGPAYPMRTEMARRNGWYPEMTVLRHPGYARGRCSTNQYLQALSRYKVAVCTSSVYGYALRKIIEAVACGCAVLTDLPSDEVMPEIDGALTRVPPQGPPRLVARTMQRMLDAYDPAERQRWAQKACVWYDYRAAGLRLAGAIEQARASHVGGN